MRDKIGITIALVSIFMLTHSHVLILPAEGMTMPHAPVDPMVTLAQADARRDTGYSTGLRWFAYGAGCWMFAVVHANVNNPAVPSHRLLGKSPKDVTTYIHEYKRTIKNRRMEMSAIGWGVSVAATFWLWNTFTD